MTDTQKAMMLTIALDAFESVRAYEEPKTARYSKLTRGIDRLVELTDLYRLEAWPLSDIIKAGDLVDEFNLRIESVFGE